MISWLRRRWDSWAAATPPLTPHELSGDERAVLSERWGEWDLLDETERERLESLIGAFFESIRFEASKGFAVTAPMRLLIAAQASLLLLGLDLDRFWATPTVIVHPSTVVRRGRRSVGVGRVESSSTQRVEGLAVPRGPVVLSWSAVEADLRSPARGRNVVYHEFAHRLDMLDGIVDGSPPIADAAAAERWIEVFTDAFERLRGRDGHTGRGALRAYGATNPAEFFAVATEAFFTDPASLHAGEPDLYGQLVSFYGQDPLRRR